MKTNKHIYEDETKWCQCDEYHDEIYYDDNSPLSKEAMKHHWRCSNCNKITQIG